MRAAALLLALCLLLPGCSSHDDVIACGENCCEDVADHDVCIARVDACERDDGDEKREAACVEQIPFSTSCTPNCAALAK
jgi:hypothetical protein